MARVESDREDLFVEAIGLIRKLEGLPAGHTSAVLLGFRGDGVLVVYFGAEPMVQFDPHGRLRRAFVEGGLYRCQGETLAVLRRHRSPTETVLLRYDLPPTELAAFRQRIRSLVSPLVDALRNRQFAVIRRWPPNDAALEVELTERLQTALAVENWIAPPLPGKR